MAQASPHSVIDEQLPELSYEDQEQVALNYEAVSYLESAERPDPTVAMAIRAGNGYDDPVWDVWQNFGQDKEDFFQRLIHEPDQDWDRFYEQIESKQTYLDSISEYVHNDLISNEKAYLGELTQWEGTLQAAEYVLDLSNTIPDSTVEKLEDAFDQSMEPEDAVESLPPAERQQAYRIIAEDLKQDMLREQPWALSPPPTPDHINEAVHNALEYESLQYLEESGADVCCDDFYTAATDDVVQSSGAPTTSAADTIDWEEYSVEPGSDEATYLTALAHYAADPHTPTLDERRLTRVVQWSVLGDSDVLPLEVRQHEDMQAAGKILKRRHEADGMAGETLAKALRLSRDLRLYKPEDPVFHLDRAADTAQDIADRYLQQ